MAVFDSTIRLRQLNQTEISGYTVQIIQQYLTGVTPAQTGALTGSFYPLSGNPSGYINSGQTGNFATQANLNSLYSQTIAYITSNYYPNTNPNNYALAANMPAIFAFSTGCVSGVDTQFIAFPTFSYNGSSFSFSSIPKINLTFSNSLDNYVYSVSVSGATTYGFYALYSDIIGKSGYLLNVAVAA